MTTNGLLGGILQPIDIGALRRQRREGLLGAALQNAQTPQGRLGATLGTVLGDVIGRKVGGEPAEIQRAQAMKGVQRQLSSEKLTPDNPEYFKRAAGLLSQAGLPGLAQQTLMQGQLWNLQRLPLEKHEYQKGQDKITNARADRGLDLQEGQVQREQERLQREKELNAAYRGVMNQNPWNPQDPEEQQIAALLAQRGAIASQELTPFTEKRLTAIDNRLADLGASADDSPLQTASIYIPGVGQEIGYKTTQGMKFRKDGKFHPTPDGTFLIPAGTNFNDLPKDQKSAFEDWKKQQTAAFTLVDAAGRTARLLEEGGAGATGFMGAFERGLGEVGAQMGAVADKFAVADGLNLSVSKYTNELANSGLKNLSRRAKVNFLQMAYLSAKAADDDGRVTDADFRAHLDTLGQSGDPEQTLASLNESANFAAKRVSFAGKRFDQNKEYDFWEAAKQNGVDTYITKYDYEPGQAQQEQTKYTVESPAQPVTDADFNSLPSGAVYRDPEDGKLYRKP